MKEYKMAIGRKYRSAGPVPLIKLVVAQKLVHYVMATMWVIVATTTNNDVTFGKMSN